MTQDIIEMTRKAGWSGIYIVWAEPTGEVDWSPYKVSLTVPVTMDQIEAFAKLVAAKEREACAKVCEQIDTAAFGGERPAPNDCAAAIRARGEA
jgi:F420-0:gamma-glutamyl ligase